VNFLFGFIFEENNMKRTSQMGGEAAFSFFFSFSVYFICEFFNGVTKG